MAAPDSPAPGAEATDAKGLAAPQSMSPGSTGMTRDELQDSFHLEASSSEDLPTLWKAVSNYQSMRALGATAIQTWKCEASLDGEAGLCWCVYPWSGKRIPGSAEVRGDPNCPQYFH
ncbi:Insulin-like growth factor-binding protein 1 [Pteropus alecto]|uniref:Insulin-like growth factor-binding protein 1 n=1 Tax=Pteropus alecto TaxID=9402 RepID=L5KPC6_PTEAL|nr:Insulin-like growth factor-binding protein 1 [Pteropus alecto]